MHRIKIAYVTTTDPADRRTWSGTNFFLWQALQRNIGDVEVLGPVHPFFLIFFLRLINFLSLLFFKRRIDWRSSRTLSKKYGKIIQKKISKKKYDLVVIPGSTA